MGSSWCGKQRAKTLRTLARGAQEFSPESGLLVVAIEVAIVVWSASRCHEAMRTAAIRGVVVRVTVVMEWLIM